VSASLYRSGQPSAAGFRRLASEIGIRTVVNLRQFHSDLDELAGTELGHEHLWVAPWAPDREEVVRFLRIATDPDRVPVLVHCMHGADRTGLFVAAYRVVVEGWSKEDAIGEMTGPSFGFHSILGNLVTWFEELDTDAIRAELELGAAES